MEPLSIKTIFDAIPDDFVVAKNPDIQKSSKKNLFYIIIGYKCLSTNNYYITYHILSMNKYLGKKIIKTKRTENKVFKTRRRAMEFVYTFLDNFHGHKRVINSFSSPSRALHSDIFTEDVIEWVKTIIDLFRKYG
jgi:hypothetical protein